jgi:hypothetical protein
MYQGVTEPLDIFVPEPLGEPSTRQLWLSGDTITCANGSGTAIPSVSYPESLLISRVLSSHLSIRRESRTMPTIVEPGQDNFEPPARKHDLHLPDGYASSARIHVETSMHLPPEEESLDEALEEVHEGGLHARTVLEDADRHSIEKDPLRIAATVFATWAKARHALKAMGVIRSRNVTGDYGEWLVARVFGCKRAPRNSGYDLDCPGSGRVEVKTRSGIESRESYSGLAFMKANPDRFDRMICVALNDDGEVVYALKVTAQALGAHGRPHSGGRFDLIVGNELLQDPDVEEITRDFH